MQYIVKKKVPCSAEIGSVIWVEPNSRSSAELNVQSVTTAMFSFSFELLDSAEFVPVRRAFCVVSKRLHMYQKSCPWKNKS